MQNGQLEEGEDNENPIQSTVPIDDEEFNEEEPLLLTPRDVLSGFKCPVKQDGDVASESLLKATAEVLIKTTMYPGSFERGGMKLEHTVNAWTPTEDTLTNLAEMLIHWGITEPSLRLSACRLCQVLNDIDGLRGVFSTQIVLRLKVWFEGRAAFEKEKLINLSLFFAETFSRIRTANQDSPVRVLGQAVLELLIQLFAAADERSVISGCHVLKLTGPLLTVLAGEDGENKKKMDDIVSMLEKLATDETLSLTR
jgi:hypothetical protein